MAPSRLQDGIRTISECVFRSMTSHKKRLGREVYMLTALKGPGTFRKSRDGEFVSCVRVPYRGLKIIDVIERNGPSKNSVAFEPGDLEVDFVCVFPTFLWPVFPFFFGGGSRQQYTDISVYWHTETWGHQYTGALKRPAPHCPAK